VGSSHGFFGKRQLRESLDALTRENTLLKQRNMEGSARSAQQEGRISDLTQEITGLRGRDAIEAEAELERLRAELTALRTSIAATKMESERIAAENKQQLSAARKDLEDLKRQTVQTEEVALLQEAGIYEYRHRLADAVAYKASLDGIKDAIKTMTRNRTSIRASQTWTVNGSRREGEKMVRDFSKLMLRAYNTEADNCVRAMKPHRLVSSIDRLTKSRRIIADLGRTMSIYISDEYHRLRLQELELTADYLAKVDEEKERIRVAREQQREEEAARRDFEREQARLEKERAHYLTAHTKLQANGNATGLGDIEAKIAEIDAAIAGVEARKANIRAGFVYVISNVGAFGERVVKIGLTRRLDPLDRVRELGDASVPFRFDVHATIFSQDAVGLETRLHNELSDRRVNRVNLRREFFYATPAEVREILQRTAGEHLLEYNEYPEAIEWRASTSTDEETATEPVMM
jgi:hypothetical protein